MYQITVWLLWLYQDEELNIVINFQWQNLDWWEINNIDILGKDI